MTKKFLAKTELMSKNYWLVLTSVERFSSETKQLLTAREWLLSISKLALRSSPKFWGSKLTKLKAEKQKFEPKMLFPVEFDRIWPRHRQIHCIELRQTETGRS